MYQETTTNRDLKCGACNKLVPADTAYFDDSTYNSLYAKVDIQKTLCFECGTKYLAEAERQYQDYEERNKVSWPKNLILIGLGIWALSLVLSLF